MSSAFNYAHAFGIQSLAAAVVFAALYAPLLLWFIVQSFRRPTTVHFFLTFFCQVRVVAFAIRAVLAQSESAGQTLGLLIADLVLFAAGFIGLIFSAYILVLDRERILNLPPSQNILLRLSGNKHLIHVALIAAVALGIVGSTQISTTNPSGGKTYRIVSNLIYLATAVLLAHRTIILVNKEQVSKTEYPRRASNNTFGKKNGAYVLAVIAFLLLVRVVFTTATTWDISKQNNEHFWYPLYALPEVLAVAVYGTPGLVPSRKELKEEVALTANGNSSGTRLGP